MEYKRFNLRMNQNLYDWFKEKADELGVPVSSYMIMIMDQYRQQKMAVEFSNKFGVMLDQEGLEVLKKKKPIF